MADANQAQNRNPIVISIGKSQNMTYNSHQDPVEYIGQGYGTGSNIPENLSV